VEHRSEPVDHPLAPLLFGLPPKLLELLIELLHELLSELFVDLVDPSSGPFLRVGLFFFVNLLAEVDLREVLQEVRDALALEDLHRLVALPVLAFPAALELQELATLEN